MPDAPSRDNRQLLLPYLAPYFAYVGVASLVDTFAADRISHELDYAIRLVLTSAALIWAWRFYVPLRGPRSPLGSVAVGVAAGLVGLALWIALLAPFASEGEAWRPSAWLLRGLVSSTLVPVFEEQLMRGYVLRFAIQWDRARDAGAEDPFGVALDQSSIARIEPGAWTWTALLISTALFTVGHTQPEWPAALAYGLLMAGLWIWRQDLLSCVVAHAVTNAALAVYVRATGQWGLW
jgi:membrane protease YdiL (CAAX protease family)